MRLSSLLASSLTAGLVATVLQGCGDCPGAEENHLSRKEAVVKMICQVAVAEEIAKIEKAILQTLKKTCMGEIKVFTNLPVGKYTVEEHCEGWGANHMLDAHASSEVFMLDNCTTWAHEKLSQNMTLVNLFNKASECLEEYPADNTADLDLSTLYYQEAVDKAKNETGELVLHLRAKANKAMNDELSTIPGDEKFEMVSLGGMPVLPWLGGIAVVLGVLGAGVLAVSSRASRARILQRSHPLTAEESEEEASKADHLAL